MSDIKIIKWDGHPPQNTHSAVPAKYPTLDLTVPGTVLETWQVTTDLIADLVHVPAALIMRVHILNRVFNSNYVAARIGVAVTDHCSKSGGFT
jgi:hypothetical protein